MLAWIQGVINYRIILFFDFFIIAAFCSAPFRKRMLEMILHDESSGEMNCSFLLVGKQGVMPQAG